MGAARRVGNGFARDPAGDNQGVVPEAQVPTRGTAARPTVVMATVVSVALAVVLAACGENKPAVCSSVDSLNQSVQNVKEIPRYTASSTSDVERELPAIKSDLSQVKADAKSSSPRRSTPPSPVMRASEPASRQRRRIHRPRHFAPRAPRCPPSMPMWRA